MCRVHLSGTFSAGEGPDGAGVSSAAGLFHCRAASLEYEENVELNVRVIHDAIF